MPQVSQFPMFELPYPGPCAVGLSPSRGARHLNKGHDLVAFMRAARASFLMRTCSKNKSKIKPIKPGAGMIFKPARFLLKWKREDSVLLLTPEVLVLLSDWSATYPDEERVRRCPWLEQQMVLSCSAGRRRKDSWASSTFPSPAVKSSLSAESL